MDTIQLNLADVDGLEFPKKDNVGLVQILNNERVMLSLSRNAMLGLGKQLIKLAYLNYEDGHHFHIDPCEESYFPQVMGFYSHPKSIEFIVCCSDFEAIETYI